MAVESEFSTYEGRLKNRWRLAWAQREAIFKAGLGNKFKSLVKCHAVPVPEFSRKKDGSYSKTGSPGCVEAHYYGQSGDRPIGYAWLQKDANPFLCFICAPKIRFFRSQEVQAACLRLVEQGYNWLFWTFTAPHDPTTDPKKQVKQFNKAMRRFKSGRWWQEFKKKWGYEHQITATELTDDSPVSIKKSGCHWHAHALAFFRSETFFGNAEAIRKMKFELARRWADCLVAVGLCSEEKRKDTLCHGFRLDKPRKPKIPIEDAAKAARYVAKGAACEMSPGIFTKNGKIPSRITHWEVMALAFGGRFPELQSRALAIMGALKGRHWLHWTKGLKKLCGLEEVTDKEIMEENKSLPVHQFRGKSWQAVDSQKWQINLLNAVIRDLKSKGFDLTLSPEELSADQVQVIGDVFAENMKKVRLGVDPEKVVFYAHKVMARDHAVPLREVIQGIVAENLQKFGRHVQFIRAG